MRDRELIKRLRARKLCKDGIRRQPQKHEREAADLLEAQAAEIERLRGVEEAFLYLCKWVERGIFDPHVPSANALNVIAVFPAMPWKTGRWDVDHKPYAESFYERFPKAQALQQGQNNE